jgi:hypothetical protein
MKTEPRSLRFSFRWRQVAQSPSRLSLMGSIPDMYTMKPMGALGVHFALADDDARRLLAAPDAEAVLAVVQEIEEQWDEAWLVQDDKAWDAMHRSLSNGTLYSDEGEYPLNRTVLGGKHLYDGADYVVSYVPPNEVKDVAAALAPITEADFRKRYDAIDPDDYDGSHGQEDFDFTWGAFVDVRALFKKAADAGRSVVFTVDQ